MLRFTTLSMIATALMIAGCGSSSSTSGAGAGSGSGSASGSASNHAKAIRFAECMRGHGVPSFPDPGANGNGGLQIAAQARAGSGASLSVNGVSVNGPAFQAAMQACKSYLPNGGTPPAGAVAKLRQTALKFAQCMRSHGVSNFPDPQVGAGPGGGVGIRIGGGPGSVNPSSPAFKSAQQACGSIMGKGFASGAAVRDGP